MIYQIVIVLLTNYPSLPQFPVNSTPFAALFFCGVLFKGRLGAMICGIPYLIAYPLVSYLNGYSVGVDFYTTLVSYLIISLVAFRSQSLLGQSSNALTVIGGSLLCALGFYLFTNTICWLTTPFYEKSLTGLYYAQWGQHPSLSQPTWIFLRNSLVGNGVFALLIFLANVKGISKAVTQPVSTVN